MHKNQELQSLKRGLKVVTLINQRGSITIAEVGRLLGLARTIGERILMTLFAEGYLDRDPETKAFFLTERVHALSDGYAEESQLVAAARPILIEMTHRIGWPLGLAMPMGEHMSIRVTSDAETTLGLNRRHVGSSGPMALVSSGIAFLAFLDEPQREVMLDMLRLSDDPAQVAVRDERRMRYLIEQTRENGYTFGVDLGRERSVALPLMHGGRVRGALLMPFMARVLSNDSVVDKFVPELKRVAAEIETAAAG